MTDLGELLEGKRVCVCAGPGGVGKTTTSAAIALGMAARGKKVAVLTIDPARRLADALGLGEIGGDERRVDPERLRAAGIDLPEGGELWALMLDAKRTFDELIEERAPDERTRDAVLSNPIYQQLSSAVAGSQEYMAMEKLHELHEQGRYDLLVLDTPPSRNALDFLDAPQRLSGFIDSKTLTLLTGPGRGALRFLGKGSGVVFSLMEKATGIDLMRDLSGFFGAFGDMAGGFRDRAEQVTALLGEDGSAFVVVASPAPEAVEEAIFFGDRLIESAMPFAATVVNRVAEAVPVPADEAAASLERALGEPLAGKVFENARARSVRADRERTAIAALRARLGDRPLLEVPQLDDGVHDLAGLAHLDRHLFER